MELRITKSELTSAVLDVLRVLPAKAVTPILGGILIEADFASVSFSAFDYERSLTVSASADVSTPDRVLVSGKLLAGIAKVLPAKPVTLKVDGQALVITAGATRFTLPLMPVEDFPHLPKPDEPSGTIDARVLIDAIERAASAAGKDETLPMLSGIKIETVGSAITFASTDRFRMSCHTTEWAPGVADSELSVLVGAAEMSDLAKALTETDEVTLHFGDGTLSVTTARSTATIRLLDCEFPKFRQLFPAEYGTVVSVETSQLSDALNRTTVMQGGAPHVLLDMSEKGIRVHLESEGTGTVAEWIEANVYGTDVEIKTNAQYLRQALAATRHDMVTLGIVKDNRPFLVHPGALTSPDMHMPFSAPESEYRHLVMPVRK
ncbi:DNA polymerase III subunit beta [Rhodococcus qingshengii]|uniref:DNA polymerase III subunit beta n=1 Tax=Rhodococcus qingshengii TaxID=334542 RepID=UPI000C9F7800|nr:DNA polymerase III subunit beta [Rhodococcus qingshengii]AUS34634.1 DNA polymerase III subunit beta [Rhodococcus qingshengii]